MAGNPWVNQWIDQFDQFWNGSIGGTDFYRELLHKIRSGLYMRPIIRDETTLDQAADWWDSTASPRFLWLHLMEPHGPYLPGLQRALSAGPIRTPLSYFGSAYYDDDAYPRPLRNQVKRLYDACIDRLDEQLVPWLRSVTDDAIVVLTADHGQEFNHGWVGHRRLYDETVAVPILTNEDSLSGNLTSGLVRQIDITPTILQSLDIDVDADWTGSPADQHSFPRQYLLSGPNSHAKSIWVGVRTADHKAIVTYDYEWTIRDVEVFDLNSDPRESNPLPEAEAPGDLVEDVISFAERDDIREPLENWHPEVGLVDDPSVEQRLRRLGYLQ